MGRKKLNNPITTVALPREMLERIDELMGSHQRGVFIRAAVEEKLLRLERAQAKADRDALKGK